MIETPLISIIMPSYNVAQYIAESVRSVLRQSYQNIELVIVDDCSTDDTWSILQDLQQTDSRIKTFRLSNNSGTPAKPRNVGINESSGSYIAFLDSDDFWAVHKLALQLMIMQKQTLDFSCASVKPFDSNPPMLDMLEAAENAEVISLNHSLMLRKNIVATSSVLLKRELLADHRFSTLEEDVGVEDYKLWLQLHVKQTVNLSVKSGLLKFTAVAYRVRSASMSRSKLKMAARVFRFLGRYQFNDKRLGWRKYFYFLTYVHGSLFTKMYDSN